jgi:outer membrane protein assembly factor BamB
LRPLLAAVGLLALGGCPVAYPGAGDCFPCGDGGVFCDPSGVPKAACLSAQTGAGSSSASGGTSGAVASTGGTTGRGTTTASATAGSTSGTGAAASTSGGLHTSGSTTGPASTSGGTPTGTSSSGSSTGGGSTTGTSTGAGTSGGTAVPPSDAPSIGIYASHDGAQAFDAVASPLTESWSFTFNGDAGYPIVGNGTVFVATSAGLIYALDLATGAKQNIKVAGASVAIAYDDATLLALTEGGTLTAWDEPSGAQRWSVLLGGLSFQSVFDAVPVAKNGIVYVSGYGSGGTTFALSEADGGLLWSRDTSAGTNGAVAVGPTAVYEAEETDALNAFDAVSGTVEWRLPGNGDGIGFYTPVYYGGDIWVRDDNGDYVVTDAGTAAGAFTSEYLPAFHAGIAFFASPGNLTAEDPFSQSLLWSFGSDPGLCTSAVIAGDGGQVFVASGYGGVYELDELSGSVISVADAGLGVDCSDEGHAMTLAGGHLLVPAGNRLVAY